MVYASVLYFGINKEIEMSEINYDGLDHAICMGIRHGLFGANALSSESVKDDTSLSLIADSLGHIADAIRELATTIERKKI